MSLSPFSRTPAQLDSFHLFTKLAPELRMKIWSFACFPRTVTLKYTPNTKLFTTTTSPPILFSVTQESRLVAQETYSLSFSTSASPGTIYFSPNLDTLYMPRCREMGYDETLRDFRELVSVEERARVVDQIRAVAIDHVDEGIKRPWEGYNKASFVRSFPSLEVVILVLPSSRRITFQPSQFPGMLNEWVSAEATLTRTTDDVTTNQKHMVEFVPPRIDPEIQVRLWDCFRRGLVLKERALEAACESADREYVKYVLPVVRIMEKIEV